MLILKVKIETIKFKLDIKEIKLFLETKNLKLVIEILMFQQKILKYL